MTMTENPYSRPADLVYYGHDAPTANGRLPQVGDIERSIRFRLEDGRMLEVLIGESGFRAFRALLLEQEIHEAADEAATP